MRAIESLRWRVGALLRARQADADLERELRFHVDRAIDERVARGEHRDEAHKSVTRTFGNMSRVREACRDVREIRMLSDCVRDVRFAWRTMTRSAALIVAVASLALAAGATSAVYGTADWLLSRSTDAVREPRQLVMLRVNDRNKPDWGPFGFAWQQFVALQKVQDGFTDIASFAKVLGVVSNDASADQVVFEYVTGNYLSLLGVRPALGRALTPDDDVDGAPPVAVVSYDYWRSHLGGSPDVIDQNVRLNGRPARIVGVLPRAFDGYETPWNGPTSVWLPMHTVTAIGRSTVLSRSTSFFPIVGRMRPGMTVDRIRQKSQVWLQELPPLNMPTWSATAVAVIPSSAMRMGGRGGDMARPFFTALLTVCVLVFIAASFNIANFLIGRAIERRRELAVRTAMGASRGRLVRQLLAEAALVGLMASALALLVTMAVAYLLAPLPRLYLHLPPTAAGLTTVAAMDLRMVAISVGLGLAAALLFGSVPAFTSSSDVPLRTLKDPRPRWTWSRVRITLRQAVFILQIGMTVALSVVAGLYLVAFMRAAAVRSDYGRPESILVAHVVATSLSPERRQVFYRTLLDDLNHRDNVVSASIGWNPPFGVGMGPVARPDRDDPPLTAKVTAAAPKFFRTVGVQMVRGREFDATRADEELIINRALADRLWPNEDPVGQRVRQGSRDATVIGVAAQDHCDALLDAVQLCAWQPFPMDSSLGYLRIRTKGDPMAFAPMLKDVVHRLDPDAATSEEASLAELIAAESGSQRLAAVAASGLALFAIVLLSAGSVTLFHSMVKDTRKEIAVRMALGAAPLRVAGRVIAHGILLSVFGTGLGLLAARLLALRLSASLYQVRTNDPVAFVMVPAVVVMTGLAGVAWSAVAAARTEPAPYLQWE